MTLNIRFLFTDETLPHDELLRTVRLVWQRIVEEEGLDKDEG